MPAPLSDVSFSSSSSTSSNVASFSMTGTRLARFVNGYCPVHDKPHEHLLLTSDTFLDARLSDKLVEDRVINVQNHLLANKTFKDYISSRMQNSSMMRS